MAQDHWFPRWLCLSALGTALIGAASAQDLAVTNFAGLPGVRATVDGTGTQARFDLPFGIALDSAGNIYVGDYSANVIRKITSSGSVSTLAGSPGTSGVADGVGAQARFSGPRGVALDAAGNIYVADSINRKIRKITPGGAVTTLAGSGIDGNLDGTGPGARFSNPSSVAVDRDGHLYVSDSGNNNIRKLTPGGTVTTLAGPMGTYPGPLGSVDGTGGQARFYFPSGVTVDGSGTVFVADGLNYAIRKVTAQGVVTTFAGVLRAFGSTDGNTNHARFRSLGGISQDAAGTLFVGDYGTIRQITPNGGVSTVAGVPGVYGTDDGVGTQVRFSGINAVAVGVTGQLYIADGTTIRRGVSHALALTLGQVIPPPVTADLERTPAGPQTTPSDTTFWHLPTRTLYATVPTGTTIHWLNNLGDTNNVPIRADWPGDNSRFQIHVAGSPPVPLTNWGVTSQASVLSQDSAVGAAISNAPAPHFLASGPGRTLLLLSPGNPQMTNIFFQFIRLVAWDDPAYLVDQKPATIGVAIQPEAGWHDMNFGGPFVFHELSRYCALSNYYDRATRTGPIIPVNRDRVGTPSDDMAVVYYERGAKLINPLNGQTTNSNIGWPYKPVRYNCQWPQTSPRIVIASQQGGSLNGLGNPNVYVQNDINSPGFNPNEEHADFFAKQGSEARLLLERTNVMVVEGGTLTLGLSLDRQPLAGVSVSLASVRDGGSNLVASFSPTGVVTETLFELPTWDTPQTIYLSARTNADPTESVGETNLFILRASGGLFDQKQVLVREADTNRLGLVTEALGLIVPEDSASAFGIRLTQPPVSNVSVVLTPLPGSDPGITLAPTSLTFNPANWDMPQTVTATAGQDADSDDNLAQFQVTATGGLTATEKLVVSSVDDDPPPRAVYALRDDLGDPLGTSNPLYSEPYTLVTYQNGEEPAAIRVFRVVAEEAPYFFNYTNNFAGRLIQPPYPLSQQPGWEAKTYAISGPWWQDRKKFFWARAAGNDGGPANIVMKFFYPKFQTNFFFPPGTEPAGPDIPWLDRRPGGTPGIPTSVTYQIHWPLDVPELRVGESLVKAKFGLPTIKGQTSVDVIYEQSAALGFGAQSSVKLLDVGLTHSASLAALPGDTDGKTVTNLVDWGIVPAGSVLFTILPPHLRSRFWWEPINQRLRFTGRFVPEYGTEEPVGYLLLNTLSARDLAELDKISVFGTFRTALHSDLAGPLKAGQVRIVGSNVVQLPNDTFALTAGLASRTGYVAVAFNNVVNTNHMADRGSPVSLQLIKVTCPLYRGETKVIYPDDPFGETVTLRHSGDFAGRADQYIFHWQYHEGPGKPTPDSSSWREWTNGFGAVEMVDGGTGSRSLKDWWYRCRWRTTNTLNPCGTEFSVWTDPALSEGWFKRVLARINLFDQRYTDLVNSSVDTLVSVISQAGRRWVGQVPLNAQVLQNSAEFGLIEIYETVLKRGIELSIEGIPPEGSASQDLLRVASQLANLYLLIGNEAYADAADPTIGFVTSGNGHVDVAATSFHCFMGQTPSVLEEELALLRGLDESNGRNVRAHPLYNRLVPNTRFGEEGRAVYVLNYALFDADKNQTINELDAALTFPQGHGDAWGHYLTAINNFYRLLANPVFQWSVQVEFVKLGGGLGDVPVNFLHERKFAQIAAAKARTGAEIVNLTYRNRYVDNPDGQWQGYQDADQERAWGLSEWASRAAQGTYLDWVTANALLPPESPGVGLAKVDRTTVAELREIAAGFTSIQEELDKADAGLNPLGLSKNVIPFDIDPARADAGETHFEQIYQRAVKGMNNAVGVFNHANSSTQKLREQADDVSKFTQNVLQQEQDFTNRLIEVFGYPYPDDPAYAGNPNVPDLFHYMYNDFSELTGEVRPEGIPFQVQMKTLDVAPDGSLVEIQKTVVFHAAPNGFGLVKPSNWMLPRRAPGEIQIAHSELLQTTARFKRALKEYANLLAQIEDARNLLVAQRGTDAAQIKILDTGKGTQESLDQMIQRAREKQFDFQKRARSSTLVADSYAEALPTGLSDATAPARGAIKLAAAINTEIMTQNANRESLAESSHQQAKEAAASQQNIELTRLGQGVGVQKQLDELEHLVRQEAVVRLEIYTQQEAMQQASAAYAARLARGQRLLEERLRFRQQTAGQIQNYRYKDMTFRIFRNEALQQYRAQFDSAAMYVYLAAAAYDYETNLRDAETRWRPGSSLMTDIVRARSLGVVDGMGNPQPGPGQGRNGDGGLAAALSGMIRNWSEGANSLRSQLGFNNPARENLVFSLRSGLFRSLPTSGGDSNWRAWLASAVVPDVGAVPEFVRYCKPPNRFGESGRKEPGLVIDFPSAILYRHNFFGWPEAGGGGNFSASYFATKIKSTAVRFLGYDATHLTTTPHVYLVPVGNDIMLSPITQGFGVAPTREWKILDQFLPTPPNYANITLNPSWIPMIQLGTPDEPFLAIRRFSQMRAYHDGGSNGTPTNAELEAYKRLIGRSAWNTKWLLIIVGGDLLGVDPDRGIRTFINGYQGDGEGVTDIEIQFSTYSYQGN